MMKEPFLTVWSEPRISLCAAAVCWAQKKDVEWSLLSPHSLGDFKEAETSLGLTFYTYTIEMGLEVQVKEKREKGSWGVGQRKRKRGAPSGGHSEQQHAVWASLPGQGLLLPWRRQEWVEL